MTEKEWTFGIDLGGSKIDIGMVDAEGHVHLRELIPTRVKDGGDAVVADIAAVIERLRAKEPSRKFLGIGIGMAGQIDKMTGSVFFAPNLAWHNFPLQDLVTKATGLPVRVTNDVRAATYGEWFYGAGKGSDDILCVFVGTGIGGGVVSSGRMLIGDTNAAGEVGHMTLDLRGPACTCGNRGCFEALAGGSAIARRTRELAMLDPQAARAIIECAGGKIEDITTKHLFECYEQKHPLAVRIVNDVKEALQAGIAGLVNAFNPERVILGGGVLLRNPELIESIKRGVPSRALKISTQNLEIVEVKLKADSGVVGAAAFASQSLTKKNSRENHV